MTEDRTREEKFQQQLRRAGAQWKEEDLDEILALLEKDYTKQTPREEKQERPSLPEPQWDIPGEEPEAPRKENKAKKEKPVKEKPVKEKKPLTEQQEKVRTIGALAGFSAAILAELTVIVYVVVQWVQWL